MIKVGLDIGNSKISCVVSDISTKNNPQILSLVSLPTLNINKNVIVNFQKIKSEVREVIDMLIASRGDFDQLLDQLLSELR